MFKPAVQLSYFAPAALAMATLDQIAEGVAQCTGSFLYGGIDTATILMSVLPARERKENTASLGQQERKLDAVFHGQFLNDVTP